MNDETVALCALNKIFGYTPILAHKLIASYGSASAVFNDQAPEIPDHPELAEQITPSLLDWAYKELASVVACGGRFIAIGDDDYPSALLECEDAPLGLYIKGTSSPTDIFSLRPMVGIVGTRDVSPYGSICCKRIVAALADAPVKPCIVSGLAFGVDGIAHTTALEHGLTTIGVMATGIEKVYPWQHTDLARRMVESPGCALVTDYPLGTSPVALNFVRRNRIIAGLASSVIVVESRKKGGSLMTARYAGDYNRDVFAVPGRLDDVRSSGCNSLISAHMAEIVTSPEELVEILGLQPKHRLRRDRRADFAKALEERYKGNSMRSAVGLCVFDNPGVGFAEIAGLTSLPYATVLECAGILEADGFITTDILQRCTTGGKW